ncbi:hypothetical protein JQU17_09335 [Ponticoccus sp. SC2-23]|uniref:hypothetical protein n=1 Tax=Alexandriicola marinus TaxID=2081710 RepID=UPI000FDCCAFC|nr:hypothetical protein [Alexandriicola marinus]MBM1220110.1 hypothetical protein [Ponticoccus sp. SC6-9]MBM1224796.1 hypothetical protein [Ponticoccus sp. SC6-15]MBM1228309.1 hypothetical protein [Ponticoccus sp. SC6-38]MBM1234053.1 hypothetical protein [Ponticoccus sp. SC6-45]MBM1238811.1 hypothetical protein [Ponticoccus sp. SC6-49]MBM1242592.1 hypothetical protein [Ponticoccus sp. SC2-64]MBM1247577.1 hypothetical protein [Ponticoccus sp. SC6-42]MBM1251764.1 hypothetical protein [Pontico
MALRLVIAGLVAGLGLTACSDPLGELGRLSEMDLPEDAPVAALSETPDEASEPGPFGFLSRLLGGDDDTPEEEAVEVAALGPIDPEQGDPVEQPGGTDAIPGDDTMDNAQRDDAENDAGGGILGFLRNNLGQPADGSGPSRTGPDAEVIPPGLQLAYGEIATVCGLSARDLGTQVESVAGFTLHDTAPGSRNLRTFYLTGFSDRCARQFTGAMVIFGGPEMHETIRYSSGTSGIPYTETDTAYEEIKGRVCGVPSGEPCGTAIDRLSRNMTFLSVYSRFGSSPQWAEILLYDDEVIAMDMKSI